jgi:hypothetical protein
MALEDKLARMCATADRDARRDLARHVRDLSKVVAAALKTSRWADLPIKTDQLISNTADAALSAAELADAADFINAKLLDAGNGRVIDLRANGNFKRLQGSILDLFDAGHAPDRGFVYVAWSARPERFVYVGMAASSNRLTLSAHGKLAHALATVSTVSLLFPTQSRKETLQYLEASVTRVIEAACGALPENNSRRETVPVGESQRELDQLATFLTRVGRKVSPYGD